MVDHVQTLLDLERRGWASLCDSTGSAFYGELMTDDGLMVLAHGVVMDREAVVASLSDAPPWGSFELEDPRVVSIGPDAMALVYVGRAWREPGEAPFVAAMSSTYVRVAGSWRLALYQQSPVPDGA